MLTLESTQIEINGCAARFVFSLLVRVCPSSCKDSPECDIRCIEAACTLELHRIGFRHTQPFVHVSGVLQAEPRKTSAA